MQLQDLDPIWDQFGIASACCFWVGQIVENLKYTLKNNIV